MSSNIGCERGKAILKGDLTEKQWSRFWEKITIGDDDECWFWQTKSRIGGYGAFATKNAGFLLAHRASYAFTNGAVPAGKVVRHSCDQPACCNPAHLELGSQADNINDAVQRGRWVRPINRKLTAAQVLEVRTRYKNGEAIKDLAAQFGMSYQALANCVHGKSWRSVPMHSSGSDPETETLGTPEDQPGGPVAA